MPFVSFEGIDGSGKSTQAARLTSWLRRTGFQVTATGEPGGGRLGRAVRAGLTETGPGRLSAMEEFLLVSASRYDHVRGVVLPALSRGEWVVCDRYVDSTFAFQVYRQDVPPELFEAVTSAVTAGAMPDFTFVLDLDPLEAEGRRARRGGAPSNDPSEATRDFATVRQGLLEAVRLAPARCRVIDAGQDEDSVAREIVRGLGLE